MISFEAVYVLSDVVESEEEMNPKSVICFEPLIVPAELPPPSYEPVFDSISPTLCSKDDVVDSTFVNLTLVEPVYVFRCVISVEPPPPPPPVELIVIPPLPDDIITFVPPINAGIPLMLS